MKHRFSKPDKEELIIIGGVGLMLLVVVLLFFLLMQSILEREKVLLRYEAEQTLTDFIFRIQTDAESPEKLLKEDSQVQGLGIFTHNGVMILGIGNVPDSLDIGAYSFAEGNVTEYNKANGMIEYLRKAKFSFTAARFNENQLQDPMKKVTIPIAEYLYISFDGSLYRQKIIMGKVFTTLMVISMISIYLFLWHIYKRNRQYRKTLAQQESLVRMGEAARTLAHEIKNPLSAISLQAAVLKKTLPKDHHEGLRVIENEVKRLNNLTNRVGEFLRNPVGDPVVIDLLPFIEQITQAFSIPISLKSAGCCPATILFDRERARSVFENLIKNAVESGVNTPTDVSIEIHTLKQEVRIIIQDRGAGLPDDDIEQLFDPFFTTKIQGSGIGLAITRRFVMAAHGSIDLQQREGGGTIAMVTLPRSTA